MARRSLSGSAGWGLERPTRAVGFRPAGHGAAPADHCCHAAPWRMVNPIVFAIPGGYALGRPISIEIERGLLLNHRVLHAPSMPDNGGGAFNTLSNKEPPLGRNSP